MQKKYGIKVRQQTVKTEEQIVVLMQKLARTASAAQYPTMSIHGIASGLHQSKRD
jgi:hypothetical protein